MRLRHIPGAEETIAASPYVVQDPQAQKGRWDQLFGNTNPIEIEAVSYTHLYSLTLMVALWCMAMRWSLSWSEGSM